jgi:hypothetical protein
MINCPREWSPGPLLRSMKTADVNISAATVGNYTIGNPEQRIVGMWTSESNLINASGSAGSDHGLSLLIRVLSGLNDQ